MFVGRPPDFEAARDLASMIRRGRSLSTFELLSFRRTGGIFSFLGSFFRGAAVETRGFGSTAGDESAPNVPDMDNCRIEENDGTTRL
jgi:hypothetical protein